MEQQLKLWSEFTSRGSSVHHQDGRHITLEDLIESMDDLKRFGSINILRYLEKKVPRYPKPKFSVSHLKHETKLPSMEDIKKDGGFKAFSDLLWWSLVVGPEEIRSAEDQTNDPRGSLWKFSTSPAFTETASLGSFRFTFTVQEVLTRYRQQICLGEEPVMRVYRTSLFPQKIQYTILVHSPVYNMKFSKFPRLEDETWAVCTHRNGCFIWRSQAMCETHRYELTEEGNVEPVQGYPQFYVYDSVAIALHIQNSQVLEFDRNLLRRNLRYCHRGPEALQSKLDYIFTSPKEAEDRVHRLWPEHEGSLEKERSLQEDFAVSSLHLVLIGRGGAGKTSSADIILDTKNFSRFSEERGGRECWRQSREMLGRFVTVVDTPAFSTTFPENLDYIQKEVLEADAILLVIGSADQVGSDLKNDVEGLLREAVWRSTILLFMFSPPPDVQQMPEWEELLQKVDNRYVMFGRGQVRVLLEEVEKMKNRLNTN